MSSSTPLRKKYVCQKCAVAIDRDPYAGNSKYPGNSNNFRCPRCLFMDSLPIIKSSKEEACSICLEDFNSKTSTTAVVINELPCRHHFHRECISEWIARSKKSCPLCRYKLPIDDTIMRPMHDAVTPARYVVENRHRTYYVPWPPRTTTPQVVIAARLQRRRTTRPQRSTSTSPPQPQQVGTTTTSANTSDHNNTTLILQDEDGDTLMLDITILQDEDGDTLMLDAA